ncbi:hypothetical protein [Chromatium okenii]|jgi:hypothetical protein|uniref:Uncharacterized protein n=1 Tax=Chromatium okenii TaxID=61644 RepID=A0A2S7XVA0_9GAMM|nr:hypothetical protein [Chromatium okenii]MBV5308959.1 hypothetical protein [Chromatium okenii]PQJ97398.1 hypothetical protein CXB77_02450 [Chromatium okenii]
MIATAQQFISMFKALPANAQKEVLLNLLRLPIEIPDDAVADEELRIAADTLFLELDHRELRY